MHLKVYTGIIIIIVVIIMDEATISFVSELGHKISEY